MDLPPGLPFLFRLTLRNLPILTLWYGILRIYVFYSKIEVPSWLAILIVLSLQTVFFVSVGRWKMYREQNDAAANGAVLPPLVSGGISNVRALVKSLESGYPADAIAEWREQYGDVYNLDLVSINMLITFEPEHVKAMLVTQFNTFEKGTEQIRMFDDFLGTGVFNSDGDMWKFHRGMTRPFFNRERISDFDIFDRHATDTIGQLVDRVRAGYPVDFQDAVSRFALDSTTEFLFAKDVRTLSTGLPYPESSPLANSHAFVNHPSNKFANAFVSAQYFSTCRAAYGAMWPLAEVWRNNVKPQRRTIDEFIEPILTEALAERQAARTEPQTDREKVDSEEETLLGHLLNHTQDTQILKDELVNMLLAGRDTTASALTFAIYMLTQHPHITERLREEILEQVGNSRPTSEQIKDMKYLRAVINETMRLYPPLPADMRKSNKATMFPSSVPGQKPFYVPANTTVVYSVFVMHRRTDLWGPDAHVFDPDRFIDERLGKYLTPNPFIFLPFNAGPRICLGQQFAYNEMSFFLVRLLQRFSGFSLAEDAQPADSRPPAEWAKYKGSKGTDKIWPGLVLTMNVKGGLWVRMEEAR